MLAIQTPFMVAVVSLSFALQMGGGGDFAAAGIFTILGLFFNMTGRFSSPRAIHFSWMLIAGGPIFALLAQRGIPHLWYYFVVLTGLGLIYVGTAGNESDR